MSGKLALDTNIAIAVRNIEGLAVEPLLLIPFTLRRLPNRFSFPIKKRHGRIADQP